MKVAIIADTHWGSRNDHPAMLESQVMFFRKVFFPEIDARGIKTVVHLGDVFDRKKYANINTVNVAWEEMTQPLIDRKLDVHTLVGNHDSYHKNTNALNSVETFYGSVDGFHIYPEPREIELYGLRVLMMPWIPDDKNKKTSAMAITAASKSKICMGHLEFTGFNMYRGVVGHGGLDPRDFDKFDTVLSGHYHTRSQKGNITYVGATGQYTWSDFDDDRGFSIFDTESLDLEFIRNPFETHCKIHYDDKVDSADKIMRAIEEVDASGKFVKLIVREKTDALLFDRVVDRLESAGIKDLQVVDDHYHADDVADADLTVDLGDTMALIENLIDREGRPDLADAAKVLARNLYAEAMSLE